MTSKIQIIVLDRGFVFVGRVKQDENFIYIEDAKNIRKWGTENGLGQLRTGPTKETVLDDTGVIRAPVRAWIFSIDCDETAWLPHLK